MTAPARFTLDEAKKDSEHWGRLVESAIGAALANGIKDANIELFYWTDRNREVDFVLRRGKTLVAVEVKSTLQKAHLPGMEMFCKSFKVKKKLLVGSTGISWREFLLTPPDQWFD
jgi:predicted AAA+ superfamily ATPase